MSLFFSRTLKPYTAAPRHRVIIPISMYIKISMFTNIQNCTRIDEAILICIFSKYFPLKTWVCLPIHEPAFITSETFSMNFEYSSNFYIIFNQFCPQITILLNSASFLLKYIRFEKKKNYCWLVSCCMLNVSSNFLYFHMHTQHTSYGISMIRFHCSSFLFLFLLK